MLSGFGMLALYCSDGKQLARMQATLPAEEHVVATDDWGT